MTWWDTPFAAHVFGGHGSDSPLLHDNMPDSHITVDGDLTHPAGCNLNIRNMIWGGVRRQLNTRPRVAPMLTWNNLTPGHVTYRCSCLS